MLQAFMWMVFLYITAFGCGQNHSLSYITPFRCDDRAKPIVALPPVYDKSCAEIGWSLSEEFTDHIKEILVKRHNMYLHAFDAANMVTFHKKQKNPFSLDIGWIKEAFKNYEFVIFTELIEHEVHTKVSYEGFFDNFMPSSELSLTMRIRIFDIRFAKPRVVLQELVQQSYPVPKSIHLNDLNPEQWKKMSFHVSPLGFAHSQFIKKVSARIEEYILLSRDSTLN